MIHHDGQSRFVAALLAALAGYVDACGFIASGGFFVSFMSGNSTRLGIGVSRDAENALVAGGLIAAFVFGVTVGTLISRVSGRRSASAVLLLVAVFLFASAGLGWRGWTAGSLALMAMAMGAENNVFEKRGEVSIGLTYMTGSLVKMGQRIGHALLGADRFGWVPYFTLWLAFVAGVFGGGLSYARLGAAALWWPAIAALLIAGAMLVLRIGRTVFPVTGSPSSAGESQS